MATTYLSVLHLATAGLNGTQLGSDEEEIVYMCLVVINTQTNQVIVIIWLHPTFYVRVVKEKNNQI